MVPDQPSNLRALHSDVDPLEYFEAIYRTVPDSHHSTKRARSRENSTVQFGGFSGRLVNRRSSSIQGWWR